MSAHSHSLSDLLRLSFSEPVHWLAGEEKLSDTVNWVTSSLQDARARDVLVLPANPLDPTILQRAYEAGISAVVLVGEPVILKNPPPDGLVVVSVAHPEGPRAVQQMLLTMLINQRAAFMERGVRIHSQLSKMAAEGEGLAGLAQVMADISGRGVLVQDKRLNILAGQPSSVLSSIWGDVLQQVASLTSLSETLRDRKLAGSQAMIVTQEVPGGLARLVTPITVGGVARGYLSLIGLAGELDALDHLVAEQGAMVCAIEMARNKAVRETEKRLKGDLLTALLQEDLSPRDAHLWAQDMGLDMSQAHVALRFAWDAASPLSRRRLETLVNGEVARKSLKVIASPMGGEVICFCQVPPNASRPEIALHLGQSVLDQQTREYPECPARCGIGTPAFSLSEWRNSFRQAGQALEMARRLGENKPLYFPDLSIYRLLFQIEHSPELIAFQEEILGPMLASEGGRDLIHTLESYFEHNGNLSQTAESLYIHRNTLIYRMERIAEITNLDLTKPETRLGVQLALHINRMMGNKKR